MSGQDLIPAVTVGVVMGSLARIYMLRIDYRQYPSYPQGYVIHVSLGVVASFLGAIVVPAVVTGDFAAASFLALAATQFREVRTVERETLTRMEETELVPRGKAYIEGIARVFEARNYLAMLTALLSSLAVVLTHALGLGWSVGVGVAAGVAAAALLQLAMVGRRIGDIARVRLGSITFEGPLLTIEGVSIMNVGLKQARDRYLSHGLAVVIEPLDDAANTILADIGQRQAIAHEVAARLGIERDVDTPEFTPLPRRNPETGAVVMAILPSMKDGEALLKAVRDVPVLEASVHRLKPSKPKAAR